MSTSPTAQAPTDHEAELRARLAKLTIEQKVRLLTGADFWSLHPEPAVGLRRLVVSDGPAGVRGEHWDDRDTSANVPSPTALAASWDDEGVERLGLLLASEARRKGVDVLLAPTVNLHRTPYGGRHFECYSEDPLLTARIGSAYVRGVQNGGVGATVKHFVANDSETDRMTVDAQVDERTLRELYLAPFDTIVREARAWSVMAAYNQVNGTTMTASPLQRDVLKGEWGFDGVIMSDWFATRSLDAAGNGLLDLVMPGPNGPWGQALTDAVRSGSIPESSVDDKVLRILRLAARVGALEGIAPEVDTPPAWPDAEISAELRRAASAGFVLARNEEQMLPLDAGRLRCVAVLGPNAATARTLGGGSATVFPPYTVSPLDGLRAVLGDGVEVVHALGVRSSDRQPIALPGSLRRPDGQGAGSQVRFLDADGQEIGREERTSAAFTWLGFIEGLDPSLLDTVEVRTALQVEEDGTYLVGVSGVGGFQVSLDGAAIVDATLAPEGGDIVEAMMKPPQRHVVVDLRADAPAELVVRHQPAKGAADIDVEFFSIMFNITFARQIDEDDELDRALALAADADVAIVVVGTTEEVESEGFDRTSLTLPGRQDELVARVAAANPRTVVVVNSGAPVLLPWTDEVAAVLLSWFPGQEFGNALADVLLGAAEPGGRLPTTWPMAEAGLPSTQPVGGAVRYDEGLFIGYRAYQREGRAPRFAFGHGLGYTSWDYVGVEPAVAPEESVALDVRLRNAGRRRGREVVQVYAGKPDSRVERPVRWLAGYAAVVAAPGEEVVAHIEIPRRALEHWDVEAGRWVLEPGLFHVDVGASSADLRLATEVKVEPTG